jgi:hypothetical protein
MSSELKIYVMEDCPGCVEARRIASRIEQAQTSLTVEVIDMADPQAIIPDAVFATPTFMLDDQVVSLGNPSPEQVTGWIENATGLSWQ